MKISISNYVNLPNVGSGYDETIKKKYLIGFDKI